MARNRILPSDFWTWEAVIDCAPMTRLLCLGLWNFADDHGVQPLRPRSIRLQVFPGDDVDNDRVRTMIDELATRGLVRIYEVDGVEYLSVIDWELIHRVGKHARRRYPGISEAHQGLTPDAPPTETRATHSSPPRPLQHEAHGHPEGSATHSNPPPTPRQHHPHPEERPFGRVSKGGQHTRCLLPMLRDGRVAASSA